jgi:hypothetical protein
VVYGGTLAAIGGDGLSFDHNLATLSVYEFSEPLERFLTFSLNAPPS